MTRGGYNNSLFLVAAKEYKGSRFPKINSVPGIMYLRSIWDIQVDIIKKQINKHLTAKISSQKLMSYQSSLCLIHISHWQDDHWY